MAWFWQIPTAALTLILWLDHTSAQDVQDVRDLLDSLAPVHSTVEEPVIVHPTLATGGQTRLNITLTPQSNIRLVADPGIRVTPFLETGVRWHDNGTIDHRIPGQDYFADPQTIVLSFDANSPQTLKVLVEYAYCVVDQQCLFGESVVELDLGVASG